MPSTVEQLSPTRVKITVEVPFADLKPAVDKAYREVSKSINLPGFRRGKVPPLVIDQRFGRGAILEQAINDALPGLYGRAVADNNIVPLTQPDVEVTKLEDGDLLEFTAEVDIRPAFELPDFSTITASVDPVEVDQAEVDARIETLRERYGSKTTVERAAANGDVVTIDLEATEDGRPLADATAENVAYTVGSGTMLGGLDEAVIGLSAGESATFRSALVGGELKDQEADITVTVRTVQELALPELNDEFAQLASEFDTLEEMRADISSGIERIARLRQAAAARDAVLEAVLEQVDVELPDTFRQAELENRKTDITRQLGNAKLTLEDYLAETGEAESPEAFWGEIERRSADALKAQLVLDKVAEERELSVTQEDLTRHIIQKAQADGTSPQSIADHLKEHPHHIEEYAQEIRRGKALALIVAQATVTDTTGAVLDLSERTDGGDIAAEDAESAAPQN